MEDEVPAASDPSSQGEALSIWVPLTSSTHVQAMPPSPSPHPLYFVVVVNVTGNVASTLLLLQTFFSLTEPLKAPAEEHLGNRPVVLKQLLSTQYTVCQPQ